MMTPYRSKWPFISHQAEPFLAPFDPDNTPCVFTRAFFKQDITACTEGKVRASAILSVTDPF